MTGLGMTGVKGTRILRACVSHVCLTPGTDMPGGRRDGRYVVVWSEREEMDRVGGCRLYVDWM